MDSLDRTRFMLGALGKYIAVGFMPQVTAVLDGFRDGWWPQKIIKSGVGNALKVVTAIIGTMWDWACASPTVCLAREVAVRLQGVAYAAAAAAALFASVQVFAFVQNLIGAIRALTGAFAAFNATALLIPAIIGAIILALGLLIDDYVNWKEGNESVIGDLIEQFPWLLDIIQTIEQAVGSLIDFWLAQWDTLKGPLGDLGGALWRLISVLADLLWPVVKMIFTGWGYIMAAVIPIVAPLIEWLAGFLVGAIQFVVEALPWIVQAAATVFQGVVAVVQFAIDAIVAYFTWWAQTVAAIYEFIVGVVGKVVDTVMGGVKGAVEWVMGLIDTAKQKVMGFIDSVAGAIGKVGQLLGLTNDASDVDVKVSRTAQAAAQAPAMQPATAAQAPAAPSPLTAPGGVVGRAGNSVSNTSAVTQTTTITAPITINSPDPAKAGESVRQELGRLNKQAVRNGQTAVAL
jgi:hypothetical protein